MARNKRAEELKALVAAQEAPQTAPTAPKPAAVEPTPAPFVLLPPDPFIGDRDGRYEFETLIYSNGPYLYAEYDKLEDQLTVAFLAIEKEELFLVGDTTPADYKKFKNRKTTVATFLRKKMKNHRLQPMDRSTSTPLTPKDYKSASYWPEEGSYL